MTEVQLGENGQVIEGDAFRGLLESMSSSISATRESIKKLSTESVTVFFVSFLIF